MTRYLGELLSAHPVLARKKPCAHKTVHDYSYLYKAGSEQRHLEKTWAK